MARPTVNRVQNLNAQERQQRAEVATQLVESDKRYDSMDIALGKASQVFTLIRFTAPVVNNDYEVREILEHAAQRLGVKLVLAELPPDQITGPDGTVYERRAY